MFRRSLTLSLALCALIATTGCATFSDSDTIARVGDVSLSQDDFEAQLLELGAVETEVLSADPARSVITTWIQEQLADQPVDEDELAATYDRGLAASNVMCLAGIVVENEDIATSVAADLAAGRPFAEAFAESNLDQQIAATGGNLPCITGADVEATAGVPFLEAAAALDADDAITSSALLDDTGAEVAWVVVVFRPFGELNPDDVTAVTAAQGTDADIYVDPRYGTFDRTTSQVVGLG